ncbi:hypothetical protein GE061_001353 [Apolygus lucorum]|uniref:Uncharacterized protein n=1 Tax=Apolygus lucorum TaxID=248454 RepID=A0A8S9Y998_APOLU|nr:hypothetical protein GE061_001353 [Apolygus lucorum]
MLALGEESEEDPTVATLPGSTMNRDWDKEVSDEQMKQLLAKMREVKLQLAASEERRAAEARERAVLEETIRRGGTGSAPPPRKNLGAHTLIEGMGGSSSDPPVGVFLNQVREVGAASHWEEADYLLYGKGKLVGQAATYVQDRGPYTTFAALDKDLRERYTNPRDRAEALAALRSARQQANESLRDYADRIQRLHRRSLPTGDNEDERRALAKEAERNSQAAFLRGLRHEAFALMVTDMATERLDPTIQRALELEARWMRARSEKEGQVLALQEEDVTDPMVAALPGRYVPGRAPRPRLYRPGPGALGNLGREPKSQRDGEGPIPGPETVKGPSQDRWVTTLGRHDDGPVVAIQVGGSQRLLLGDTGAQISLLHQLVPQAPLLPCTTRPRGLGGYLHTAGEQEVEVNYGGTSILHRFVIADVRIPGVDGIMGVDLMTKLGSAVWGDMGGQLGFRQTRTPPDNERSLPTAGPHPRPQGRWIALMVQRTAELEQLYRLPRPSRELPKGAEGADDTPREGKAHRRRRRRTRKRVRAAPDPIDAKDEMGGGSCWCERQPGLRPNPKHPEQGRSGEESDEDLEARPEEPRQVTATPLPGEEDLESEEEGAGPGASEQRNPGGRGAQGIVSHPGQTTARSLAWDYEWPSLPAPTIPSSTPGAEIGSGPRAEAQETPGLSPVEATNHWRAETEAPLGMPSSLETTPEGLHSSDVPMSGTSGTPVTPPTPYWERDPRALGPTPTSGEPSP